NGTLDVLAQHVLGRACAGPFDEDEFFNEVRSASPYAWLDRATFSRVVEFVATGGYALRTYERYARIRRMKDGRWRISHPSVAQQYRLMVGTVVAEPMLNVRLIRDRGPNGMARGGMVLGQVEVYFLETLTPGDTFFF